MFTTLVDLDLFDFDNNHNRMWLFLKSWN